VVPGNYEPNSALAQLLKVPDAIANPDMFKEIRAAGGVDLNEISIKIIASNTHGSLLRILDIEPVSLVRNPPLDGTMFLMPTHQGIDDSIPLVINLDDPMPLTRAIDEGMSFFDYYTVSLKTGEQQVFDFKAETARYDALFALNVVYLIDGQKKQQTIDNNGHPFHVVAPRIDQASATYSYQRIYEMQTDFSMKEVPDPHRVAVR